MEEKTKILIGIGILVVVIIAIVLVWAPWITDECAIDKVLEKIGGHGAYYSTYGSPGGDSIYDAFSVHWIPFGRFVVNYEDGWFVFFYNCIIPEEKPKEITKERAIAIANATEEVKEFLKLYPDAKPEASEFGSRCNAIECDGPWLWMVMYHPTSANLTPEEKNDILNDVANEIKKYKKREAIDLPVQIIAIDFVTGEILSKYPKIEYYAPKLSHNPDDFKWTVDFKSQPTWEMMINQVSEYRTKCENENGKWACSYWNTMRNENFSAHCYLPLDNFGKKCLSSNDCEGMCLVENEKATTGKCSNYLKGAYKCDEYYELNNGTVNHHDVICE